MQEKPDINRRRAAAAVRRAAAAYRTNREELGPLVQLVADVLAFAALVRMHREMQTGEGVQQ